MVTGFAAFRARITATVSEGSPLEEAPQVSSPSVMTTRTYERQSMSGSYRGLFTFSPAPLETARMGLYQDVIAVCTERASGVLPVARSSGFLGLPVPSLQKFSTWSVHGSTAAPDVGPG